ncbi:MULTISPECIES: chemotaxis protein CheW [Exiguobacterium]|uniref:Chemotaxis protein CheW n=1 Tax=Exiguobacterium acetylicum TaxID=41170 RepID=A0ABX8G7G9_EXIAC|nr:MULTISPECIES: chemotaxis protein CheW [Exiguobacterium]AOT01058.1 chemotaxis protein CheW [Exiguobacterium sp. U13-1]OAI89450.1 chemotaxis protein CheW [Exiguobacterium sp. KKBO11]QWB29012.1 chemotaxis protein CheW [Exiguobacterium acetylicum]HBQ77327.1 chemotaxis protein CheW [Exiguobacterium sp.]HCD59634.1 chemotaxis protein CheW [Exiguobacterium sp.]
MEQKWVVFQLEDNAYGIDVQSVRSIERLIPITRIPNAASYVKGVINLRGVVTPVIDLRARLGFELMEETEETRIIIATLEHGDAGFIVDRANEVVESTDVRIEPLSEQKQEDASYLTAVAKGDQQLFSLIEPNRLFEDIVHA